MTSSTARKLSLHNVTVDARVAEHEIAVRGALGEVQPDKWVPMPVFDRDGRPLEYFDTEGHVNSYISPHVTQRQATMIDELENEGVAVWNSN